MNTIIVAGYIGKDAEMRYMTNGDAVCNFSVSDNQGKDKPPIWWRCSLFGKRAESLCQYLTKGSAVTVSGSLIEREYTDKDGTIKKSQDLRVAEIALQGGASTKSSEQKATRQQPQARKPTSSGFDDESDGIPF